MNRYRGNAIAVGLLLIACTATSILSAVPSRKEHIHDRSKPDSRRSARTALAGRARDYSEMRAVMAGGRISPARRLGGISFVLSGMLYLIKSILDLVVGDPPSTGPEILEWRSSHELALAWTSEVLFAAAVLLVPAVIALYRSLDGADRPWVGFGCGVFAAIIPTLFAVLMAQGRLAFPVYGITLDDPATAALVVSLYYGGMHAVNLLLAGTAIMLGLAMTRGIFGAAVGAIGVVAGAAQIVVAYPWLVTPILVLMLQALLAAWLILVGLRLAWFPRRPSPAATNRAASAEHPRVLDAKA